ncbi:hypothetical protein KSB_87830 [Ktedonobacter robiniae]|uniref:Uncharacterized protein n=1 Tax=Ktedonobacter robiniae TaxID=2778365 RepID=A0ABQ3V5L1_9CHLR|nr:hypothetical protein KSB_87830 [Ktedonobacter robiniae]
MYKNRLLHHVEVIAAGGKSFRIKDRTVKSESSSSKTLSRRGVNLKTLQMGQMFGAIDNSPDLEGRSGIADPSEGEQATTFRE